jgi:hypothetical protein
MSRVFSLIENFFRLPREKMANTDWHIQLSMRSALFLVKRVPWKPSATLAASRASFTSAPSTLALARPLFATPQAEDDLPSTSTSPKKDRPRSKVRPKPTKAKSLMPPPPPSSSRDGHRPRFPPPSSSSNKRGGYKNAPRRGPPPLPDQLEGGLHDMAFVKTTHGKDGEVELKQKYLDAPKSNVQDYMKWVYGKALEAAYREGHIGRTKLFRYGLDSELSGIYAKSFQDVQ